MCFMYCPISVLKTSKTSRKIPLPPFIDFYRSESNVDFLFPERVWTELTAVRTQNALNRLHQFSL